MKKWDNSKLKQPTSHLIPWFSIAYMNCFSATEIELLLHAFSLVAWPFQTQYFLKLWDLL